VIEVASAESHPAPSAAPSTALYAPGREILTLLPGGHYDFASGDSIATAQVSGVLALLLAKRTALSAADAYRLLRDTSARTAGAGGEGALIDACAAMTALVGQGSCNPRIDGGHDAADLQEQRIVLH
jgi:subtilisin family serine protease